ncbi:MAG: hypothetical protein CMG71_02430 [Candidatus Marinimicrobia bacterium]|nr:hypothetical protein [Candidatus Neomarinimicrobiota bacterium]|tara:strand:- start:1474 stop:2352 length:879 start_codon:yes stop_codon:yes gene_type:complete
MLLLGGNFTNQNIDWWHGALDSTGDHDGDLISRIGELNLNYGITDDWNLQLNVTGGNRRMNFPGVPNIHHRSEGRTGLATTKVMLRYLVSNRDFGPGDRFFLGLGLSIPSKQTLKEDPFALGKLGREHTHFAMSEGVYRSVGEIQFFRRTEESPFLLGFVGRLEIPLGPSEYGYLPGTELAVAGMNYWQGKDLIGGMPYFIVTGQFRMEDYWDGVVSPNSGATIIQAGGGLVWNVGESLISLNIQVPVVFETNMVGVSAPVDSKTDVWLASLSIRKMFDLFGLFGEKEMEEE